MPFTIVFALAIAAADTQLAANNYTVDEPMARPAEARLVWSDEFEGKALDLSKWSFDTHRNAEGWYNEEAQYYSANRPENARVENGRLIIEARHDPDQIRKFRDWGRQKYSSARIVTKGKAAWTYGFYEIRAKLPCARGMWPAIWMLPESGRWPDGGEIDILEHVGSRPNFVHANLHTGLFNHAKGTGRGAEKPLPTSCSEFHDYQLDWRPDVIIIGVDGRAYMKVRNDQPGGIGAWPFDKPFHMILNLAVGGGWAGSKGIDDAAMPQAMEVDYVRVWSRAAE
jgi:beta-glucanase (GH16 family)